MSYHEAERGFTLIELMVTIGILSVLLCIAASGSNVLTSDATGLGATPDTFTVCRQIPSAGAQERVVTITAAGRASVKTTNTGVCP